MNCIFFSNEYSLRDEINKKNVKKGIDFHVDFQIVENLLSVSKLGKFSSCINIMFPYSHTLNFVLTKILGDVHKIRCSKRGRSKKQKNSLEFHRFCRK